MGETFKRQKTHKRRRALSTGERKRMRRSLTITDENDKKVQNTRSLFLDGQFPLDLDYTTTVNIFIELGHKLFLAWAVAKKLGQPNAIVDVSEVLNTIFKYASDVYLKDEAAMDLITDAFYRRLSEQYQKLMKQLQETQKSVVPLQSK